ncbi:hypothetical protein [Spirosoma aerolatum]|uniref:hypothetical protein n=1 Tax=Spirosoma aerolatum TaxID=1211326 RepID=UPI0009AC630D|nr:hypothetical protein [Spirosoma aerolatum]
MFLRLLTQALSCLALFLSITCTPSLQEPASPDYTYFPLETGRFWIYDVQEKQFTSADSPVQRTYQLKELVGQAYTDVTGQQAYRLLRYKRSDDTQPWQPDSVWSVRLVNNLAIRSENGRDFVSLLFPISDQSSWNGNQLSGAGADLYVVRNVGQPYRVLAKQFDNTVTVIAQDDSTLVSQDKRMDVYARGIGLVYKERTHVQFCTASPTCIGHQLIDYGTQQIYRIRTYGTD